MLLGKCASAKIGMGCLGQTEWGCGLVREREERGERKWITQYHMDVTSIFNDHFNTV